MIDEYASAVSRFADDLWAVGIPLHHLDKLKGLYSTALFEPSREAWSRLYRHTAQLLQQWLEQGHEDDAARRVFACIDDDFGRNILEAPIRAHLRELLLKHHVAS